MNEKPSSSNTSSAPFLPSQHNLSDELYSLFNKLPERFSQHIIIHSSSNGSNPELTLPFMDLYDLLTEYRSVLLDLPSLDPVVDMILSSDLAIHEKLELIEASLSLVQSAVKSKKLSPDRIIRYYLFRGDFFWDQNVFETAIYSYQNAINTMLIFNVVLASEHLLIPMKIGDYWSQHLDYLKAMKMYETGIDLFLMLSRSHDASTSFLNSIGPVKSKYQQKLLFTLQTIVQVYVFSSIAYHWESKHDDARVSLLQSIIYLAKALEYRVAIIHDAEFQNLLAYIIRSYSRFRHLSDSDYEILDTLKTMRATKDLELLKKMAVTLRQYCETEYEPLIYGLLITTDTGLKLYSFFTEELPDLADSTSTVSGETTERERNILDSSDLYSSLFSALGASLRTAFKRPRDINQIKHGDITILVEKGLYTLSFLFADKETIELREKLKRIVYFLEDTYHDSLEHFTGALPNPYLLDSYVNKLLFGHYMGMKD